MPESVGIVLMFAILGATIYVAMSEWDRRRGGGR